MAQIRTENAHVQYGLEQFWGIPPAAIQFPFGIHELVNAPDPSIAFYPFWGVNTGRSRGDMFPGPWTLRGSIPDIRIQRGAGSGPSLAAVSLGIGSVIVQPGGNNQYFRIIENLDTDGLNQEINSFTMQIAMSTTGVFPTFPPIIRNYVGGKVSRWSLVANEGDSLRYNIDEMIFRTIHHNLPGVPGYDPSISYSANAIQSIPAHASQFYFAGAAISLAGVTLLRVKSFNLSGDNQLQPKYYDSQAMVFDTTIPSEDLQNEPQILADLPVGKRRYQLGLELEIGDYNDIVAFSALLFQGRDPLTGDVTGYNLQAYFNSTAGSQPTGAFNINCIPGGIGYAPGAVVTDGSINLPGPPAPYYDGRFTIDLDSIYIDASIL